MGRRARILVLIVVLGLLCGKGILWAKAFEDSSFVSKSDDEIVLFDLLPVYGVNFKDQDQRRQFWDLTHLVFALQGIVNRDAPRLYVRFIPQADDFWWQQMRKPGGWLAGRKVVRISVPYKLVRHFRKFLRGLVVWDERVPATANLASTIAGAENLLPVRYDPREGFLYRLLTEDQALRLPVVVNLRGTDARPMFTGEGEIPGTLLHSTGSAKCDAYLWLVEHYLKTRKLNPAVMGYYIDAFWLKAWRAAPPENCTLSNHDYIIAHRGLIFDLDVWEDEAPVDDRQQPHGTDLETLKTILRTAYELLGGQSMIQVCGFVPWAYKYTRYQGRHWFAGGRHGEVDTEWRYAAVLSCYNAYMDADALGLGAMANASFFQHFPLRARYSQPPRPTREVLRREGFLEQDGTVKPYVYVAHYVGDYDSSAWLYRKLPEFWKDPARGKVRLSWAFNPNLSLRFPLGMAWARKHASTNDWFVAGDSGAGYLNPGYLIPPRPFSGLPSGLEVWREHCARLYRQWDITLTGFVIDGFAPGMNEEILDAYATFSPDGVVAQKIEAWGVHKGMPFVRMRGDLSGSPEQAARQILRWAKEEKRRPAFLVCRSILQSPSWYAKVNTKVREESDGKIQIVDLYTLMALVKQHVLTTKTSH